MIDTVTIQEAQSHIDPLLVAEILTDFATTFRRDYPAHITARGVGPEQAMIGLAIKNGHLVVRDPAVLAELPEVRALVAAALQRALGVPRKISTSLVYRHSEVAIAREIEAAILALIPTDHAAALDATVQRARDEAYAGGWDDGYAEGFGKALLTAIEAFPAETAYGRGGRARIDAAIRAGKVQP